MSFVLATLQEDMVCLSCTATGERVCLAAEGFGNRHCYLENIADKVSVRSRVINHVWSVAVGTETRAAVSPEHTPGPVAVRVRHRAGAFGARAAGAGHRGRV